MLLTLHLIALGIWIGVIAAEFVIEFDGMRDQSSLIKASKLHYATDWWVEVPAFCTVLITGALMLNDEHLQGLFVYKLVFAVLAIIFNVLCVYAVAVRRKYAVANDDEGMRSTDLIMKIGGAGFLPSFVIAIVLAFSHLN